MRSFTRQFDGSGRTGAHVLATFTKLKSGSRRAQVRRKGKHVNETFLRGNAEEWALEVEYRIDRCEPASSRGSPLSPPILRLKKIMARPSCDNLRKNDSEQVSRRARLEFRSA
jgi:hypothetical protein